MSVSILWKGVILVSIPLLFEFAFFGLIARIQREDEEARRAIKQSEQVVDVARTVLFRALDAEAELRGLLLSGKPAQSDPYERAVAEIPFALRQLEDGMGITTNGAAAPAHLRHCADAVLKWLADLRGLAVIGVSERAAALASSDEGKRLMDDLRSAVDAIVESQRRFGANQAESFERSRTRVNGLLMTGRILSVVLTAALALVFWRGISSRFQRLKSNISELAAGRALAAPLQGNDEFAQIDASLRKLVEQLAGALEAARRSSAEARDLFDSAPCGYHSVDANGMIVAMNRTELGWLGYDADEVIGKMKLPDLLTPSGKRDFAEKLRILKQRGEIINLEYELVRKDGTTMPVLLSSKAVLDANGEFVSSRTSLFDNTERKRAELSLSLFADVVKNSPVGKIVWRLDNEADPSSLRLMIANPAASNSLGIDVNALVGKTILDAFPGVSELECRTYADVARTGVKQEIGELLYQDERVAPNYWHVLVFPLADHCVGVSFENVTERRRMAEEKRRMHEDLERRVRERTSELGDANRDLSAKNQENEMFVYSVSHDLRSPLVNLQGFSIELEKGCQALAAVVADAAMPDDLRARAKTVLDGKMSKSLGFIKSAVLRLSGIIDALLRLSRAGRVEYHVDRIDMNRLMKTIVDSMQTTMVERNATVQVRDLPGVLGDRTALEQVFANLIGNALVYLDPKRPGEIEVGFQRWNSVGSTEGLDVYYVKDNGLGIAEAYRQKIFQVFQRAHPGVGKGEGIGLAVVARIVERHRGRVWVESTVGQGSTFFVALPGIQVDNNETRAIKAPALALSGS